MCSAHPSPQPNVKSCPHSPDLPTEWTLQTSPVLSSPLVGFHGTSHHLGSLLFYWLYTLLRLPKYVLSPPMNPNHLLFNLPFFSKLTCFLKLTHPSKGLPRVCMSRAQLFLTIHRTPVSPICTSGVPSVILLSVPGATTGSPQPQSPQTRKHCHLNPEFNSKNLIYEA